VVTALVLKAWSKKQVGMLKQQANIANETIFRLDQA